MDSHTPAPASGTAKRPARTTPARPLIRWVRRLTVAVMAALVITVLVRYPTLPVTVATHFGPTGQADRWGPRSSVLLLMLILVVLIGGCTWLSYYPRVFNYPVPVTEHSAERLYLLGEQMMVWSTAGLVVISAGMVVATLWGFSSGPLVWVGIAVTLWALVSGIVRMFRV